MRVLIADDERITRQTLRRHLERWGHDVIVAEDGTEAWACFEREEVDIVVTDWDMPGVDGRTLIERIRASDSSSYLYLIMLTSHTLKAELIEVMEAGADDFLSKPFDKNELRVRIRAGERIIELQRALAEKNRTLTAVNDRMSRDLEAAASIQRDLLPSDLPDTKDATFAWHFEPCDEVGGDILDAITLAGGCVAMYLLDVSGHGVPAALLSVTLSRVINALDPESTLLVDASGPDGDPRAVAPPDVAGSLNRRFTMRIMGGRFFTLAYGVLDTETRLFRYTLAGHPPPMLVRVGQPPRQLEGCGLPIGVLDDAEFEEYRVQLEPGDRVIFYSDGITEARSDDGAMLEPEGLVRLLDTTRSFPLDESVSACIEGLRKWCGGTPFNDDISILAVEVPAQ